MSDIFVSDLLLTLNSLKLKAQTRIYFFILLGLYNTFDQLLLVYTLF